MKLFLTKKDYRLRKNLRGFGKKKVDVAKYVKDLYVDNGLAYISLNVKGIDDIIDPYSVKGYEWLNPAFAQFIESNAWYVPTEYPIILEICGHHFTPEEKENIEATIADYYALHLGDAQLNLEENRRKNFMLIGLSVLATILMIIGQHTKTNLILETITIFFWVCVWDFLDSILFERSDLVEEKKDAAQLASIKVIYKEQYIDMPVSKEKEEEIIAEIFEDVEGDSSEEE